MTDATTGRLDSEFARRQTLVAGVTLWARDSWTPEDAANVEAFESPYGPLRLPECEITNAVAPGRHGQVPLRVYAGSTSGEAGHALVWIHGGAFLGGDLDMPEADHTARYIAGTTGCPVISVDYRLATGGVHHPVPEDDVVAAYEWVRDGGTGLAIDPDRVAIGGASAGACLAASAALRLRDVAAPPWKVFLIYPVVHWDVPEPGSDLEALLAQLSDSLRFTAEARLAMNENYVGGSRAKAVPYAFPGDSSDLSGLPPTYIEVNEFDDLRPSGELFARQLQAAGVSVQLHCAAGLPHGHLNWRGSPHSYATLQRLCDRLKMVDR